MKKSILFSRKKPSDLCVNIQQRWNETDSPLNLHYFPRKSIALTKRVVHVIAFDSILIRWARWEENIQSFLLFSYKWKCDKLASIIHIEIWSLVLNRIDSDMNYPFWHAANVSSSDRDDHLLFLDSSVFFTYVAIAHEKSSDVRFFLSW